VKNNLRKREFVVKGSVSQVAEATDRTIEEALMDCEAVVFVDTSASMNAEDSREGRSRYDVACTELGKLQNQLPGKVAVVSFSSSVVFCPNGTPQFLKGSTDVAGALKYGQRLDRAFDMRFILISDGEPDNETAALKVAAQYRNRIDTIFVGRAGGWGRDFLKRLAAASGGQAVIDDAAQNLLETTKQLLLTA